MTPPSSDDSIASLSAEHVSDERGYAPDDRMPPQALGAEQSVLGSMMLNKDAIADCLEVVKGRDFYRPNHEVIFDAVLALFGRGEPADAITVADELTKSGDLMRVGGQAYLHQLIQSVPTAANAGFYAEIVQEHAILRRTVEAGTRIIQMGYAGEGDANEIAARAQAEAFAITDQNERHDYAYARDLVTPTLEWIENATHGSGTGIPTGFYELDSIIGGLAPGQMVIVAGRPATGKSTISVDIARHAAIRLHKTTAIFSLEMDRTEIMLRVFSAEATIKLNDLRKGVTDLAVWDKLAKVQQRVIEAPLIVDDSPNLTMMEIRAKCRRMKQQDNLELVVIDYLQLMSSGKKVESRQQEVAEFSRSIKLLAKELEIPIIAVCQLNRGPEQRADKRPAMSDLRESGSLEQDADMVILVHRDKSDPERDGEADVIVAKQRNGPTGDAVLAFQGHYSRFNNMARPDFDKPANYT